MRWFVFLSLVAVTYAAYLALVPRPTRCRYETANATAEIKLAFYSYQGIWIVALLQCWLAPSATPQLTLPAGAALFICGRLLAAWAMRVNPWFTKDVRWAPGQEMVTAGPYRLMRHPGYIAFIWSASGMATLLGQQWAWTPCAIYCGLIIRRMWRESRFLATVTTQTLGNDGNATAASRDRQ